MNTAVKTLFAAAAVAVTFAGPVAAQNAGSEMLMSQISSELSKMGFNNVNLDPLSLNDLVSISTTLNSPDENDQTKQIKVRQVLVSAGAIEE